MISLEPRTPHQPEKLQKLSKNDCVFTPSAGGVNKKLETLCPYFAMECKPSTGLITKNGATGIDRARKENGWLPRLADFERIRSACGPAFNERPVARQNVKIAEKIAQEAPFREEIFLASPSFAGFWAEIVHRQKVPSASIIPARD